MSENVTKNFLLPEFDPQSDEFIFRWGDYPLEINCGAVARSRIHGNVLDVQAITSKQPFDVYGIPKSLVDDDEIREFMVYRERRHQTPPLRWSTRSVSIVIPKPVTTTPVAVAPSAPIVDRVAEDEELLDDWRSSPSEILAKLQDPSATCDELFEAVLFAEIAEFDESQTEQLLKRLFAFVDDHRLSQDDDTKTVVGAAIRKLAMNLRDEQFEQYANLFLPTETDTLSCEIELELAKAIVWRLISSPASLNRALATLEERLAELAMDYLKPRLILQKNYASVALQAAIGVSLLRGKHSQQVVQSIGSLRVGWFSDLFQRRLKRLQRQLQQKGDTVSASIATNLESLVSTLQEFVD